jgi:SAM-dependent methyltransferase
MTTLPPERVAHPDAEPHQARQVAESFGSDAGRYDRARPGYPAALVQKILAISPGPDILDVGCGTGISARQFQAAGCRVLGVDPDARMADLASKGGLRVEVARFEDWNPAGREFDAVIAGQAWHWVDPVAGAARAVRAVRPGGLLAAFWNAGQAPAGLSQAFAEVYQRVLPGSRYNQWTGAIVDGYRLMCAKAADGMREAGLFGEPEQWQFDWERPYTRDEWLDAVPTFGGHSQIPAATLDELLAGIGSAIDTAGGSFTMSYATLAVTAARAAA